MRLTARQLKRIIRESILQVTSASLIRESVDGPQGDEWMENPMMSSDEQIYPAGTSLEDVANNYIDTLLDSYSLPKQYRQVLDDLRYVQDQLAFGTMTWTQLADEGGNGFVSDMLSGLDWSKGGNFNREAAGEALSRALLAHPVWGTEEGIRKWALENRPKSWSTRSYRR
jgi:hypothetical protein